MLYKIDAASPIRNSGDAPWNGRREKMTSTQNAICSLKMTEFLLLLSMTISLNYYSCPEIDDLLCELLRAHKA